jgi:hypothetical protein
MRRLGISTGRWAGLVAPAMVVLLSGPASPEAAPTCFGESATIVGTSGDDKLTGTPGPDVIVGRGGRDKIRGLAGPDLICGKHGRDQSLKGGVGDDRLSGGPGDDFLEGNAGGDIFVGGLGNDTLSALYGNPGDRDTARGGRGQDVLDMEDGESDDTAAGGPQTDTCYVDDGDTVRACEYAGPG